MRSPIVPVGASTLACELRTPWRSASSTAVVPSLLGRREQLGRHELLVDLRRLARCMRSTPSIALALSWYPANGPIRAAVRARSRVGVTGHQCGDGGRPGPPFVGVVRETLCHEQGAQVGVADAELSEPARVVGDLLRRVVGVADEDLLGGEYHLDRGLESLDVELVIVVQELEQVDARQIARRVVEMHVFAARVAAVDPTGHSAPCATSLIVVSNCIPGIGALPRRVGDLAEQVTGVDRTDRLDPSVRATQVPVTRRR